MIVDVAPRQAIDIREFVRFVGTGVTATIGNLAAVWIVARHGSFGLALLAGSIASDPRRPALRREDLIKWTNHEQGGVM